jgi:glutathione peroxidase-family protein
MTNSGQQVPTVSFYSLQAKSGKGETIDFAKLKGKQVLVVNSASDCGYTPQYEELEALHQKYPQLVILIFPANDFKQQEKKGDAEIEQFCKINYGLTIPLMSKVSVVKGPEQLVQAGPGLEFQQVPDQQGGCTHTFFQAFGIAIVGGFIKRNFTLSNLFIFIPWLFNLIRYSISVFSGM